jgi:hypothetical protein
MQEAEKLCDQIGAKLVLVLFFSGPIMSAALNGKPRFDQSFLDFLKEKTYPVVDTRDFFVESSASSGGVLGAKEWLRP